MPILEMHLMKGRTEDQKCSAARAVTEALVASLGVNRESVRILITEHGEHDFFVSGMTMKERSQAQLTAQQAAQQPLNAEGK